MLKEGKDTKHQLLALIACNPTINANDKVIQRIFWQLLHGLYSPLLHMEAAL
jgi:hypothetical protein